MNYLLSNIYISCEMICGIFHFSWSRARLRNGFALVPFFAIDRATTNGGTDIPFRSTHFAREDRSSNGGSFHHGRLQKCTNGAYLLVFTSWPLKLSNLTLQAFLRNDVSVGLSRIAAPCILYTDFFIPALRALAISSELNLDIASLRPSTFMIIHRYE